MSVERAVNSSVESAVQAQFQQLAMARQLVAAIVHDSAHLGDESEEWVAPFWDLVPTLARYINSAPPLWAFDADEASCGAVPVSWFFTSVIACSHVGLITT